MKSTIRDVANQAGVSVATVSHVINNTHYVSPELKKRVFEAVEALNYRQNKLARALNRRDLPLLALIVPDISNPYWSSFARSVQDITDQNNYSVIVCSSDGMYDREIRFLRSLSGWISGLILHPYHITQEEVNRIIGNSIPLVILGDFTSSENQPSNWDRVASNNLESARLATEYLIGLGHRNIAFIQGPEGTPTSLRRLGGYQQALEKAGLPIKSEWIVPGDYTHPAGYLAMKAMLGGSTLPTAVFCANDLSALGALEAAKQLRYRVPQDLSIVGFDDIDEAVLASPPLTTIRLPPRYIGNVAAETLLERLKGREEPKLTLIEGTLIIRQSTAEPAKSPAYPSPEAAQS